MAAKVGDVVFKAGEGVNLEEFWDDSALIKAYEKAVNSFKYGSNADSVENSSDKRKNRRKRKKNKRQAKDSSDEHDENPTFNWSLGDKCQAVFSEDCLVYNAEIIEIYEHIPNTCVVRYTDYGNEEEQYLTDLLPFHEEQSVEYDVNIERNTCTTSTASVQNGECTSQTATSHHPSSFEWQVSDLCMAPELPHRHLHEAVINSFPSHYNCKVTFIRSRQSQEVNIQDLQESNNYHHHHQHNSSYQPANEGFHPPFSTFPHPASHLGNYPYYPFQPPSYPMPQFDNCWPTTSNPRQKFTPKKGIPRPPVPPPPPPISLGDLGDDDDSLASMLMSWYLSGYHTGYFKAVQQFKNNDGCTSNAKSEPPSCHPTASRQSPKQTDMDTKE